MNVRTGRPAATIQPSNHLIKQPNNLAKAVRILLTARRGFDYNRTQILLEGLRATAPEAFVIYEFADRDRVHAARLREFAATVDLIYIPPFRTLDVRWVKANAVGRPVLFDPLISNTITRVVDYGWWWRRPFARRRDRRTLGAADYLLFDTEAHKAWSVRELGFDESRCHVLYIGADTTLFPLQPPSAHAKTPTTVGFYGSLVPLQGVDTIIRAMHALRDRRDIRFELIGDLGTRPDLRRLIRSHPNPQAEYFPYLPLAELAARVANFDICLGIFGPSEKANVVIPNKVYHYASLGLPIITRESAGMSELFEHGRDIYTVPHSDPEALAAAIEKLVTEVAFRQNLGRAAGALVHGNYGAEDVARSFLRIANRVTAA